MKTNILCDARPSTLAAARRAVEVTPAMAVQPRVLGMSAVATEVRTAPIFGSVEASGTTSKINYIGKAASLLATVGVSAMRDHQVQIQLDKAKGVKVTDARGIPPRGRPV